MSRYVVNKQNLTIVYGYDDMMPPPMGGYFFQVFDETKRTEENEGVVINEGFVKGISKSQMINLMTEHGVTNHSHLTFVALDLPI
jgi:hypothetical protein